MKPRKIGLVFGNEEVCCHVYKVDQNSGNEWIVSSVVLMFWSSKYATEFDFCGSQVLTLSSHVIMHSEYILYKKVWS